MICIVPPLICFLHFKGFSPLIVRKFGRLSVEHSCFILPGSWLSQQSFSTLSFYCCFCCGQKAMLLTRLANRDVTQGNSFCLKGKRCISQGTMRSGDLENLEKKKKKTPQRRLEKLNIITECRVNVLTFEAGWNWRQTRVIRCAEQSHSRPDTPPL